MQFVNLWNIKIEVDAGGQCLDIYSCLSYLFFLSLSLIYDSIKTEILSQRAVVPKMTLNRNPPSLYYMVKKISYEWTSYLKYGFGTQVGHRHHVDRTAYFV